jgi:GAF domain-containing protein/HAMP domain-containing protein
VLLGIRWGSLRVKIIAWTFVPTASVLIVVALVTFTAYREVTEYFAPFLLVLLALGVVAPALVVAIGIRRITRPIAELIGAAQEVAGGRFGQTITARTGDEIEELAEQFNRMSAQLQESYAHLEQRVADRTRQLAALNAVAAAVSRSLDLEETLCAALSTALEVLDFESGAIHLRDVRTGDLHMACHRGLSEEFQSVIAGSIISASIARSTSPIIIDDLVKESAAPEAVTEQGYRSLASVPLVSRGQVEGVLTVSSRRAHRLRQQDVDLLLSIGHQVGVAIENARLFQAEQRRVEQFKLISEVGRRITSILEVDELLEQLARLIQQAFNYYLVDIGLVEEGQIVYKAGAGRVWEAGFESFRLQLDDQSITGYVILTGRPLLIPDVNQETRYVNTAGTDTRSEVAVPLKTEEKVIGVLNVESDRLNAFDDSDVVVLQSLADQAAIAIEKARLFKAEQRRADQFRVISQVGSRITVILDVDELLGQMSRLIQGAFNYYHVGIGLIEGDEVTYKVGAGPLWDDPDYRFKPARLKVGREGITGRVAQTGEPLLAPDVSQEPCYVWMQGSRTRSELAVAIKAQGEIIGVLDVQSDRLDAFDATDMAVLQSLADQAGVAIQNARLFEAEQRRAEQFRVIGEIGHHITSILPVDELLGRMVRLIQEAFSYYAVGIGLVEGDEVVFKAGAGAFWDDFQLYRTLRLKVGANGFTGWVARTGEPLLVPDVSQDARYYYVPEAGATRSEIAVPLKIKGTVIGVLGVQRDRLSAFDESDLVMLQSLSHQAAIAIENARLYERAKELAVMEERQRLARELHDAVTQTLFSASLVAEVLPRLWERHPDEARRRLEDLRQMTRGALAEMRTLLMELRPAALADADISDLLRQLAESITGRARVPVTVTIDGQRSLPPDVKVALYRIAQEALNNMAKHAGAKQAAVSLRRFSRSDQMPEPVEGVELRVNDDGRGFDRGRVSPEHLGLGIMRERAEAIGAALTIDSEVGRGTQVTVVWASAPDEA